MLVTWRGTFLSLYNPSVFSDLTNTDSNRFFVKLSLLQKFIWYCMTVLSFVLIYFFPVTADSFLQKARKTNKQKKTHEIHFFCFHYALMPWNDCCLVRPLKCSEHSLQSREIFIENVCFSIYAFVRCWHKVFRIFEIIVPLTKRYTGIKLRDHQFVCRLHRFSSW